MSVFVSGATGFIGAKLVRSLVDRGEKVSILCRPAADLSQLPLDKINVYQGDLLDKQSIRKALAGCDKVFHIAGYAKNWSRDPSTYFKVNVEGTKNILDEAIKQNVKRAVVTSTCVTLGPSGESKTTEQTIRQVPCFTTYEESKLKAEEAIDQYVQRGLEVVLVNPTRVFGPGAMTEGNSLTKMIDLYLRGRWRLILGSGEGIGNYGFVDDVVRGHILAMERGKSGERYLLGGENLSYNDFFKLLAELSNKHYRMIHMPSSLAMGYSYFEQSRAKVFNSYPQITPSWVKTFLADWAFSCEKAKKEIGYSITPLRDALSTTVKWLKS